VANVVGALVISNPINLIVCTFFKISFLDYAAWMALPALVSIVTTYTGLRLYFRRTIPARFRPLEAPATPAPYGRFMAVCGIVLVVTLVSFFSEGLTGVPTWLTAVAGAAVLLALQAARDQSDYAHIVRGIGWDVIVFVVGIFIVANGLRNVGLTAQVGQFLRSAGGSNPVGLNHATGFTASVFSSVMNNHPTADMMAMVIRDLDVAPLDRKMLVFSALIGGDLGPKMLPIGSLAALLWFRILRQRGVHVPYSLYIRIGIPVTLAAIFLSIMALNLELLLYRVILAKPHGL
jgi:arsenical pump membrane protein